MQPSTATQTEISHNPRPRSSGKRDFPLAAKVARELGVVPTWRFLQIIRLAIESEAELSRIQTPEVAEMLILAGRELSYADLYHCPSEQEKRELSRLNSVDYFWFQDSRWRAKRAYVDCREKHREQML